MADSCRDCRQLGEDDDRRQHIAASLSEAAPGCPPEKPPAVATFVRQLWAELQALVVPLEESSKGHTQLTIHIMTW